MRMRKALFPLCYFIVNTRPDRLKTDSPRAKLPIRFLDRGGGGMVRVGVGVVEPHIPNNMVISSPLLLLMQ